MKKQKRKNIFSYFVFKIFWILVKLFYPKTKIYGARHLPKEPCIIVGNHTQMNGPIISELYFPGKRAIWCAGQMMELREVPKYAFKDFWSEKSKYIRWFYKILSYVIAPFSVCIFNNAHTIPVYHDNRVLSTFKRTVSALNDGANIIIFPECAKPYNHIINRFQERFVDVAKLYYKRTGSELLFVPMYIAPSLKSVYIGEGIRYNPNNDTLSECHRICDYLMNEITKKAVELPEHIVVPYNNIPKKLYKTNRLREGEA